MIKRNLFLSFVIAFTCSQNVYSITTPLADALKQKKVHVEVTTYSRLADGNYHSSYFNQCMQFKIKNLTSAPMMLTESAGRFLMPDDSSTQRMMTTADITFTLKAGEEKAVPLFAMCTEASDGAPSTMEAFTYGNIATGELKELVSFIARKNYQKEAAQSAVWAITNDYSPYSIYDNDTSVMNSLRRTVCKLKKIPYDPNNDRVTNNTPLIRYITGTFTFSIYKEQKVDLVLFTDDNKLIKDVLQNQTYAAGTHSVSYEASIPVIDPTKTQPVTIMFYLDGKLFAHKKHVLQPWR